MVLESLIGAKKAERMPLYVFLLGLLYSSIGVVLSLILFRSSASLVVVFMIVFAAFPLVYHTLKYEADKDLKVDNEPKLLRLHARALRMLMYLFLGILVALALWYVFLPASIVQDLFATQMTTIQSINGVSATGNVTAWNFFSVLMLNNLKVLIFCLLFSFFYGSGFIFILTWNASVISAAVGNVVRTALAQSIQVVGFAKFANYFQIFSLALLRYMTHGVFEIAAYFVAGLAGGLISIAMINKHFEGQMFRHVLRDVGDLFMLALVLLLIGALVEVFITPLVFSV